MLHYANNDYDVIIITDNFFSEKEDFFSYLLEAVSVSPAPLEISRRAGYNERRPAPPSRAALMTPHQQRSEE